MKSSLSSLSSNLSMSGCSSSSRNSDTQHPNLMKVKISHTNKLPQNKLQDPMLSPVRLVGKGTDTIKSTLGGYTGLTKNFSGASALDKLMKFEKKYSKPEIQSKKERNFPIEKNRFIEGSSDLKHSSASKSSFQNHSNVTSNKMIYKHLNNSGTRKYPNDTLDLNKVKHTEKDSVSKKFELSNDLEILENIGSLSQLDELISSNSAFSVNEYISDLSSSNNEKASLITNGDLKTKYAIGVSRYNNFRPASPNKEAHKSSSRAIEDPSHLSFKSSFNPSTKPNSETRFDSNQSHGTVSTHERQIKLESSEDRLNVDTFVSPPANTMDISSKSGLAEDIISDKSRVEELKAITSFEGEHYSPPSAEEELSIEKFDLQTKIHSRNASISATEPISRKIQIGESNNGEEFKMGIIRGNIYKNESTGTTHLDLEPEDNEDTILSQDSYISKTEDESDESYHNIPIKLHTVEDLHSEDEEIEAVTKESLIKPEEKFHFSEEHTLENRSEGHISEEILEDLTSKEHSINYSTDINSDEDKEVESKISSVGDNFSVTENTRLSANFRSDIKYTSHFPVINNSGKTSVRENKINTSSSIKSSVRNTAIQTDLIQPTFTSKITHDQNVQHTDFPEYFKFGKNVEKLSPYPVIQYSVEPEVIEAMASQKPVETALNEMLRHQIDLTRHFMSAQYAMYEAYMKSVKMLSATYKPITLEDTKKFIEEHRRKKASY